MVAIPCCNLHGKRNACFEHSDFFKVQTQTPLQTVALVKTNAQIGLVSPATIIACVYLTLPEKFFQQLFKRLQPTFRESFDPLIVLSNIPKDFRQNCVLAAKSPDNRMV
ncbi:hypothetical protein AAMO2058_000490200 [Amorphochlora amoebiformis]